MHVVDICVCVCVCEGVRTKSSVLGKLQIGEINALGSPPQKTKTETKTIKRCWWLSYSIYLVNSRTISSIKEINAD